MNLLEQIEQDALDSKASVTDALRKCVALGGRTGSAELKEWATRELRGYWDQEDVPPYRKITAPIVLDGITGWTRVVRQQVSSFDLPERVQEAGISEQVDMKQAIGELEEAVRNAQSRGESVQIGLPQNALIAKMLSSEGQDHIERLYWNISPVSIVAIIDQVRTTLVEFVAELRTGAPNPNEPSSEAVTNAVQVAVYGKRSRVKVNTAVVGGDGTQRQQAVLPAEPTPGRGLRRQSYGEPSQPHGVLTAHT